MSGSRLCLLGAPWDLSSSFVRGAAAAPRRIREALWSPSTNTATELGIAIEPDTFDDRGDLATSLLPPPRRGLPPLRLLRYQLLTAVAGSLAWARQREAPRAVLVIHEFHTSQTSARKLQGNALDLDLFVTRLTAGTVRGLAVGSLVGPIRVPGDPLFDKPADLYLGKIVRRVSPPGP